MADNLNVLYVADKLVLQGRKIYIWGNDEAASGLFVKLSSLYIKIHGFVSDEWKGTTFWHRPVVALEEVDVFDSVICIPDTEELQRESMQGYVVCEHPVILNPEFDEKQAVIYGAGTIGRQVLHFLQSVGIEVLCFIDSDRAKVGSRIEDILIEESTYLNELPASAAIIEAGCFYKEIDRTVTENIGDKKRFYWDKLLLIKYIEGIGIHTILGIEQFPGISKFYLYGVSPEQIEKYEVVFGLMDIQLKGVWDAATGLGKSVEDLLYEDDYLILVNGDAKEARKLAGKLGALGMCEGREYTYLHSPAYRGRNLSINEALDLNLGYTYIMDKRHPGFQVLGMDKESDYRIVLLGGSTTDGWLYEFKSWADFLYEKCKGYHVTIFNGGISGYTSTQELVKLLRDGITLNPDMIIVYDGVNDAWGNYRHKPYSFTYLESVFLAAAGQEILSQINNMYTDDREGFDIWIENVQMMHAIAQSRGIKFLSFLQPMLCSKKKCSLTSGEKTIIRENTIWNKEYVSEQMKFRRLAKERGIEELYDYMYDLSDLFDEEDVYIDDCHVHESGNKIIADKIWEKVKDFIAHFHTDVYISSM